MYVVPVPLAAELTAMQPDRWDWRKPYEYPMVTGDPWDPLKNGAYTFDKEMCDAWNGELDTILTFVHPFVFSHHPCKLTVVFRLVYFLLLSPHSASRPSKLSPKARPIRPMSFSSRYRNNSPTHPPQLRHSRWSRASLLVLTTSTLTFSTSSA